MNIKGRHIIITLWAVSGWIGYIPTDPFAHRPFESLAIFYSGITVIFSSVLILAWVIFKFWDHDIEIY